MKEKEENSKENNAINKKKAKIDLTKKIKMNKDL
jgi:hypothetical protein